MDKILIVIVGAIGVAALLFISVLMGTVFGGIGGWVVGAVFPYVTDTIREASGLSLTDFQLGAVMGFIGSYIRSILYSK